MEELGSFNGLGFYSTYRLVLMSGLDSLIQPPEMKEPESYDWQDENGVEVYLDKRYVKPRNIQLGFLLMADNEQDFWQRHIALTNLLISPGYIRLYIEELGRSFFVYYARTSSAKAVTTFKQDGKICAVLTLDFNEPKPSLFKQYNLLMDESGNFFTDGNGNKILMDI